MARALRSLLLMLGIGIQCGGCYGWRVEQLAPAQVIEQHRPRQLRVEHADGSREVLYAPAVHNDTLVGRHDDGRRSPLRAIPVTDVRTVARLRIKPAETVALSALFVGVLASFIALASWGGPLGGCCGQ